ncbi:MAG: DMT family transporter [Dehalobacterium sp.]
MNKYYHGVVMVLLCAFSFALGPTFAKFAYKNDVSVMTLLFFRSSIAGIVLFCCLFITKQNLRVERKALLGLFFLGAVCNTMQSFCFFSALNYIPASLTVVIAYTYPALTAIATCILDHEVITKKLIFSLIGSFAGLTLMLGTTLGSIDVWGIILAAGSSLLYTIYVVLSNRILKKVPNLTAGSYILLFSIAGTLFISLLSSNKINFGFQGAAWPWILGFALFTAIGIISFFKGLKILGPTKATVLCTSEPLFGVAIAIILFQDRLTALQLLGAAGVIAGAVMSVYTPSKDIKGKQLCQSHAFESESGIHEKFLQ